MSGRLTGCVSSPWMVPTSTALATRRSQPGRKVNGSRRVKRSRIAGSSVIASTAAIAIEKFLVKASGLKSRPSCASSAKIGRNETAITRSEKKLGPPTSFTAPTTTSRKSPCRPSAIQCSSFLCVCSTTTIAASTIAPIATAIPPSDMMFAVFPLAVELDEPAAEVGPEVHAADVSDEDRRAVPVRADGDLLDVGHGADVAAAAHHVLRTPPLDEAAADVVIRAADRVDHLTERE